MNLAWICVQFLGLHENKFTPKTHSLPIFLVNILVNNWLFDLKSWKITCNSVFYNVSRASCEPKISKKRQGWCFWLAFAAWFSLFVPVLTWFCESAIFRMNVWDFTLCLLVYL
jgi:membrane protein YqaA with SNARE-associated domain